MSKHGGNAFSSEVSYGSVISTEAVAQLAYQLRIIRNAIFRQGHLVSFQTLGRSVNAQRICVVSDPSMPHFQQMLRGCISPVHVVNRIRRHIQPINLTVNGHYRGGKRPNQLCQLFIFLLLGAV